MASVLSQMAAICQTEPIRNSWNLYFIWVYLNYVYSNKATPHPYCPTSLPLPSHYLMDVKVTGTCQFGLWGKRLNWLGGGIQGHKGSEGTGSFPWCAINFCFNYEYKVSWRLSIIFTDASGMNTVNLIIFHSHFSFHQIEMEAHLFNENGF